MEIHPIRNDADLKAALVRLEAIAEAEAGTAEADEFDVLSVLVESYERTHYPIPNPTPLGAIRFRMEQSGYTRKDLERILGSRARVAEILNGTRGLSVDMVRALNREWGIAVEVLLPAVRTKAHSKLAKTKTKRRPVVKDRESRA